MQWREAVMYMQKGGKIRRSWWLKCDYLYMKNEVLMCDGHFPYLEYLKSTSGEWYKTFEI